MNYRRNRFSAPCSAHKLIEFSVLSDRILMILGKSGINKLRDTSGDN